MDKKRVYTFGNGLAEGKAGMRNLLGGKGANLAEMNLIGVPVPPGFTITTDVCTEYYEMGQEKVVSLLKEEVEKAIANIENLMRSKFGDVENPLLVSVRSGARASMPGMMDTILNLGLNDEVVEGLTRKTGNARFAWDSYRRFVQMYGDVVLGMKPVNKEDQDPFEAIIEEVKHAKEEGIEFLTLHNPIEYLADEQGRVKQVILQKMELGEPDASGRRSPVPIPGATETVDIDLAIVSVGVSPNPIVPSSIKGLELGRKGTITVNDQMQSSIPTIYAGGDIVRGGATVILAMGDGRRAAAAMNEQLSSK